VNFLQLCILLIPGLLAAEFYEKLQKQTFNLHLFIIDTARFTFLILFLNVIAEYIRGWYDFDYQRISVQFLIKYIPLNLVFIYLTPYLYKFIDYFVGRFITGKYKSKF